MSLKDVRIIDSVFRIPEGAEDEFEYASERIDDYDTILVDDEDSGLATPDSFTVISQTIRRGKGSVDVVDVVFETDLIEGATKYEIKITKVTEDPTV